jgi:CDP-glycerol glycerophosphotransferase (TagB/SpsB family)
VTVERFKDILRRAINRARVSPNPLMRWSVDLAQHVFRLVGWLFPALSLGWVSALRSARWDGDDLVLTGWSYVRGARYGPNPRFDVYLSRRWVPSWLGGRIARADTRHVEDLDVLGAARRAELDYRNTTWEARFPAASLVRMPEGQWQLRAKIRGAGRRSGGRVKLVYFFGSPAVVPARSVGERLVTLLPHPEGGADVAARRAGPGVRRVEVSGRDVSIVLDETLHVESAVLHGRGQKQVALTVQRDERGLVLAGSLPPGAWVADAKTGTRFPPIWRLSVDYAGSDRIRGTAQPTLATHDARRPERAGDLYVRAAQDGALEVVDVPFFVDIDTAHRDGDRVAISGQMTPRGREVPPGDPDEFSLVLASAWAEIPFEIESVDAAGRFTASALLRVSAWGGPALPLKRGVYVLEGRVAGRTGKAARFATFASPALIAQLPVVESSQDTQLRFELNRQAQLAVRVNRPRQPDEYGSYNQRLLFQQYGMGATEPLDAVYFESFFGRGATCNPRAIDAEVARRRPDLPRYWSVDDLSVAVPEGATPLVIGSRQWWEVRESARWIVTNEWLRGRYVKKQHQTVLQTWHGSMYKRIGIDRGRGGHIDRARAERANWDMFISQNGDTTPIITQAYEFEADPSAVLEIGYPRNDELATAAPERGRAVRRSLAIPEDHTVVMYAPTWREQGQKKVEFLSLLALAKELGSGFTFLQRGHVRTLEEGAAIASDAVIDVSTYPQINDLFLAADLLITDYSSMMFDYSVTGRPMLFFTPDIEEYTDPKIRGVYFDLEELAPGPVVRESAAVADLLRSFDTWKDSYADRYGAWRKRFNHLDDGHASARAVDALFAFDPSKRQHVRRRRLFDPDAGEDA